MMKPYDQDPHYFSLWLNMNTTEMFKVIWIKSREDFNSMAVVVEIALKCSHDIISVTTPGILDPRLTPRYLKILSSTVFKTISIKTSFMDFSVLNIQLLNVKFAAFWSQDLIEV